MAKLPAAYDHPAMGTFTRDENDDYVQENKRGRSCVLIRLNCGYEGPKCVQSHLRRCETIAMKVHHTIHDFVHGAAATFANKQTSSVNTVRAIEGKKPIGKATVKRGLRLLDVCISPNDLTVCFTGDFFDDEHDLFMVRYGPRLGFKEAYIE